ncbi:hypothetical protein [Sedimenticola selenatireducens]|uniref:Uncharacterized protein n=1 Tax=Sedimenticola selenatireducens TaxID=191960 RepID=A0A557S4B7_9GAMM|nr:hypothetical protein [Sedimenticola selenatireducens]TVO72259.1 hypothetical protein FHP88_13340 [Sedimenticola selenatireducens]TVT61310.1 MAG: hypothetical protein FHK78_18135 [Sedimenticola selenatireducens]
MNSSEHIRQWAVKARNAEKEAHKILSKYESSKSRVVVLKDLLKKLDALPIDVKDYFSEAIECLERDLRRAASVMSWAGFFQVFSEKLYAAHEVDIRSLRTKWNFKDLTELKENYAEAQILDVAKEVKFINKALLRVLQGHLATRNQCAHPTLYKPSLNSCIGYVDEMINKTIQYT